MIDALRGAGWCSFHYKSITAPPNYFILFVKIKY